MGVEQASSLTFMVQSARREAIRSFAKTLSIPTYFCQRSKAQTIARAIPLHDGIPPPARTLS